MNKPQPSGTMSRANNAETEDKCRARHGVAFEPIVSDLLVAWQKTREAIGRVETSQTAQLSDAMSHLVDARGEMESAVREFMMYALSR
jgi:hypothetical protein